MTKAQAEEIWWTVVHILASAKACEEKLEKALFLFQEHPQHPARPDLQLEVRATLQSYFPEIKARITELDELLTHLDSNEETDSKKQ